jgi:NADH:ubiquinone oxidoreductase subunit K
MRFFQGILPHISMALNLCLVVVVYLDHRNPMMGFLMGAPFFVLVVAAAAASVTTAITLYALWRNPEKRKQKAEKSTNNT